MRSRGLRLLGAIVLVQVLVLPSSSQAPATVSPETESHLVAAQEAQRENDLATAEKEYKAALSLAPNFAEIHMNLGLLFQLQGKEAEASDEFREALKLKPNLTGANFFLGVNYCNRGDGQAAIRYLKKAATQDPEKVEILSWLATAQDMTGDLSAEIATLARALKLQPENVSNLYLSGQAYERLGKQRAARLRKMAPESVRAEELVAESYAASNEWPSAVIHFENAIAKSPTLAGLHVELGEVYLHAGKLKQASAEFERELAADPANVRALVRLGEVQILTDRVSQGISNWNRALEKDAMQVARILGLREMGFGDAAFEQLSEPLQKQLESVAAAVKNDSSPGTQLLLAFANLQRNADPQWTTAKQKERTTCSTTAIEKVLGEGRYSMLANCSEQALHPKFPGDLRIRVAAGFVAVGEYDLASRLLDSLSPVQKNSAEASYWQARCYEKLATQSYLRMYRADPSSFRVHQLLGDLAATRDDDEKATEEYRSAVKLNPGAPNLHYSLGHILWKDLKIPEAREEFEAELKINPRHAGSLHDLGNTYLSEHHPEAALPLLQKAEDVDPKNPEIHRDLGTAYVQLREYAKAETEYKLAITGDQDGSVHYKLAKVYQALGQKQDADREFATYTAMNRESHEKLEKRGQRLADIERSAE